MMQPTLKNYVARYKTDKRLLETGNWTDAQKELLKRRIERHKQDIVDYVTSERFETELELLDL